MLMEELNKIRRPSRAGARVQLGDTLNRSYTSSRPPIA